MAIDPNKMAAFAQQGPKPGSANLAQLGKGGGEDRSVEPAPPSEDMQEGGQGRFSKLISLLEENAEELEACCDELDPEQLASPDKPFDDDNYDIFMESFASMEDDLKDELVSALADGLTPEQADQLATHLEGENMIEDSERVANYLLHIARAIEAGAIGMDEEEGGEAVPDEESEEDEEEYGEEEGDDEDGDEESSEA
jgi:hypothetical protein